MTQVREDELLGALLRDGNAESGPDAATTQRAHAQVHSAWIATVAVRRRQRSLVAAMIGAGLVLSVTVLWNVREAFTGNVATVQLTSADIATGDDREARPTGAELELGRKSSIETDSSGGAALRLRDGAHLRLDQESSLRLHSPRKIELVAGGLYFDSSAQAPTIAKAASGDTTANSEVDPLKSPKVSVQTRFATLYNLGTRYEARVSDSSLEVAVRQGKVVVELRNGETIVVRAGELIVLQDDGSLSKRSVAAFAQRWQWTQPLAPPFATEARSLGEFLDWIEHELGLTVRLQTQNEVRNILLRGDLVWSDAANAIAPTLRLCGLEAKQVGGVLLVSDRGELR